ncbi:MAG: acyloxyacyl hydrolase [Holophagales bacterium]|nr:acyloxyacyl hydrolase [Holophagales bacterium]
MNLLAHLVCPGPRRPAYSSETSSQRRLPVEILPLLLALAFVAPATAQDPATAEADPASGWAFSLGSFDIIDKDKAFEAGLEYRWQPVRFWRLALKPVVGVSGTDEGSFWGYGGFRWDIPSGGSRFVTTLGFAVAAYEQGDGKNLGGTVEFRSSIDLAYRLKNGSRIGLSFYHLSNARIYRVNPGSESLVLTWSLGR